MRNLKSLNVWVLGLILMGTGLPVGAEPTAQADLEALRQGFESPLAQNAQSLERLKQRLAPLPQRLKQLVQAQQQPLYPDRASQLEQGLASSRALAERSPQWQQFPKKEELKTLLEAAQSAQAEAARQVAAGQDPQAEQARARQLTQQALALLQQPQQNSDDRSEADRQDAKESGQQQPDTEASKSKDAANQTTSQSEQSQQNQPQKSSEAQAQKLNDKQALKELLKLQQQAEAQKEARREQMGLYRSGPQPVERDW